MVVTLGNEIVVRPAHRNVGARLGREAAGAYCPGPELLDSGAAERGEENPTLILTSADSREGQNENRRRETAAGSIPRQPVFVEDLRELVGIGNREQVPIQAGFSGVFTRVG